MLGAGGFLVLAVDFPFDSLDFEGLDFESLDLGALAAFDSVVYKLARAGLQPSRSVCPKLGRFGLPSSAMAAHASPSRRP